VTGHPSRADYEALERETARLFGVASGGLGVRVHYVYSENDP
jgi:hypothetical protein